MKKTFAAVSFALVFLLTSTVSHAVEKREPTGSAMFFDIVFTRPLGLLAIALGTAVFVVGLPFTIPTGSVGDAADKLIADPLGYTFKRPVGELDTGRTYLRDP